MHRLTLWCWHTPYVSLLARALPDWQLYVMPTTHAPNGWRDDQRQIPPNVRITVAPNQDDDLIVLQNGIDLRRFFWESALQSISRRMPAIYLAHNRVEYDFPDGLWIETQAGHIKVVCISEMKARTYRDAGYSQPITVIPPGIPIEDYGVWRGDEPHILTVCNNLRRPLFDLDAWLAATAGLPVKLIGEGNEGIPGAVGPAKSWDELRWAYQHARVYFSVNKWPNEDGYNLALLEAMAIGIPCVALASPTSPFSVAQPAPTDARDCLRYYLSIHKKWLGSDTRDEIARSCSFGAFAERWQKVLEEVTR